MCKKTEIQEKDLKGGFTMKGTMKTAVMLDIGKIGFEEREIPQVEGRRGAGEAGVCGDLRQ